VSSLLLAGFARRCRSSLDQCHRDCLIRAGGRELHATGGGPACRRRWPYVPCRRMGWGPCRAAIEGPTPEVVKGKRWCAAKRGESRQKREGWLWVKVKRWCAGVSKILSRVYIREHTTRRYSCELAIRHTIIVYMVPPKMGCVARISNSRNRCQNDINLRGLFMLRGVVALTTTTGTDYPQRPTHT